MQSIGNLLPKEELLITPNAEDSDTDPTSEKGMYSFIWKLTFSHAFFSSDPEGSHFESQPLEDIVELEDEDEFADDEAEENEVNHLQFTFTDYLSMLFRFMAAKMTMMLKDWKQD